MAKDAKYTRSLAEFAKKAAGGVNICPQCQTSNWIRRVHQMSDGTQRVTLSCIRCGFVKTP